MKKSILILMLAITSLGYAQKIMRKKKFLKYEFIQNDIPLSFGGVVRTLHKNEEAYQLAKSARNFYIASRYTGFAGGFAIGYGIFMKEETNWKLIGIGAGFIAVSISLEIISDKKIKKALNIYNSSISTTAISHFKPSYQFIVSNKGLGFGIKF